MKKRIYILSLLALAACGTPESERIPAFLEMTPDLRDPSALETTIEVAVRTDLHWTVELEDASWGSIDNIRPTEGSGGVFTFNMGCNTGEDPRENTLILRAGKGELRTTVRQGGIGTYFQPRSVHMSGSREGLVEFLSPSEWKAQVTFGGDWLGLETEKGYAGQTKLRCYARDANELVGAREGTIRVQIGGNFFEIPVVQDQKDVIRLSAEDLDLPFPFEPQEFSVQTQYNVEYTIDTGADWITRVTAKSPLYESVEVFSVAKNEAPDARQADIRFTSPGHPDASGVIHIQQEGMDPILHVTAPGLYGTGHGDFVRGAEGWNQSSCRVDADGQLQYRLLSTSTLGAVTLVGLRKEATQGDACQVSLNCSEKEETLWSESFSATVLYVKDGLTWLKVSPETYFVINR